MTKKTVQKGHPTSYGNATAEEVALAMRRNMAPKRKMSGSSRPQDTEPAVNLLATLGN